MLYTTAAPAKQNTAALDSFINGISHKAKKFNEQQTLNTVTVKARKWGDPETRRILELDEKYTTGMFSGVARGFQLNVLDDETAWSHTNICNYIKYRVPGLSGVNCNSDLSGGFPMLFINEINVTPSDLLTINVSQIAYIKFISGIVIGSGFTTSTGVIYIYLKKGDEPQRSYLPQMRSKMIKGYDLPKQFASPDYTNKENLQQQDRRSTLYWNPYLNTEADKKTIRIEFYNNDISKKLLLVVEGINEEGRLIYIEKLIEN